MDGDADSRATITAHAASSQGVGQRVTCLIVYARQAVVSDRKPPGIYLFTKYITFFRIE